MGDVVQFPGTRIVVGNPAGRAPQEPHCNCEISPPPEKPPHLTFTVWGWVCSACFCIVKGVPDK